MTVLSQTPFIIVITRATEQYLYYLWGKHRHPSLFVAMAAEPENENENGKQHPLHFMTRVSENVSVYRPEQSQQAAVAAAIASSDDPDLIILLGWMGAGPRPLSKYCNAFREMFPTSKILLMRSSLKHQIWQPGM